MREKDLNEMRARESVFLQREKEGKNTKYSLSFDNKTQQEEEKL